MHAYRDAIPDARSVWILYPGGEFPFLGVQEGVELATNRYLRLTGCREVRGRGDDSGEAGQRKEKE